MQFFALSDARFGIQFGVSRRLDVPSSGPLSPGQPRGFLCLLCIGGAQNWRRAPALVKLVMTTVLGLSAL